MSAIGGVYCFEGYNQDSAELLTVIGKSLAAHGPDGGAEPQARETVSPLGLRARME